MIARESGRSGNPDTAEFGKYSANQFRLTAINCEQMALSFLQITWLINVF